jgi:hypothetical protein
VANESVEAIDPCLDLIGQVERIESIPQGDELVEPRGRLGGVAKQSVERGVGELTVRARTGMGNKIDLAPSGLVQIPPLGSDRDLLLEQRPWLGSSI